MWPGLAFLAIPALLFALPPRVDLVPLSGVTIPMRPRISYIHDRELCRCPFEDLRVFRRVMRHLVVQPRSWWWSRAPTNPHLHLPL